MWLVASANRQRAQIQQRIGRYDHAARAASAVGDGTSVEDYVALLDRDVDRYSTAQVRIWGGPTRLIPWRSGRAARWAG
jgi:hypothetical protein